MCKLKALCQDLRSSPIATINNWQNARFLWAIMAVVMILLVVLAHSLFQNYIYMKPCEQCVYIRFSMLVIALGGIFAVINPRQIVLKVLAYLFSFYGAIIGVMYSVKLDAIHKAVHSDDPFGVQGCSTDPTFPFGLRLEKWAPDWFKPTGDCGYDNPIVPDGAVLSSLQEWFVNFYADGWYLVPDWHFLNMAQACLIAYVVVLVFLCAMLGSWAIKGFKTKARS